jgi:hypothetical protein
MLLGNDKGGGAVDQVPVCWILDFNWTPLYTHIFCYMHIQLGLAPNLAESNHHVSCGVSINRDTYLL